MNICKSISHAPPIMAVPLLAGLLAASPSAAQDGANLLVQSGSGTGYQTLDGPKQTRFFVHTVDADETRAGAGETPWLGVGAGECPEPLTAQLGLRPGEGLVVNYVATNSPASEADLQKNDVLVELDGQMLVDPVQLRKLVQMHANGDTVKIEFYRAGKKQSVKVKLAMHKFREASLDGDYFPFERNDRLLLPPKLPPGGLPEDGTVTYQVRQATDQARHAMEDAKRAMEDAMRQAKGNKDEMGRQLEIIHKQLGDYAKGGVALRKDATVTVKNDGESIRTLVRKDKSGTYIIVADPTKHLTAHNADGKLLYDDSIETPEQQQKVPKEIWTTVQPMVDQMSSDSPAGKPAPADQPEE